MKKKIDEVDCYNPTIEILNDGRISLGVGSSIKQYNFTKKYPKGLLIYDSNNFKFSFSIENYGPNQRILKNGNLLAET